MVGFGFPSGSPQRKSRNTAIAQSTRPKRLREAGRRSHLCRPVSLRSEAKIACRNLRLPDESLTTQHRTSPLDGGLPQAAVTNSRAGRRTGRLGRGELEQRRYSGRNGDDAAAPAPARGLGAHVPADCAPERGDARRDHRVGCDRAADRLRARLPPLARLPAWRLLPEEGLHVRHRVLQSGDRVGHDPRHARGLRSPLSRFAGARRWLRWLAGLTFGGTAFQAPLGAITVYSGLNPWVVMSALPALARSCLRRRRGRTRGVGHPRRAGVAAAAAARPRRGRRVPAALSSAACSRPQPGRTQAAPAARPSSASGSSIRRLAARPRDRRVRRSRSSR